MDELATVKSALPSVVMHSGALEPHSLFCTVYTPPLTAAVCDWQSWVVAARAPPDPVASSPAASSPAAARPAALFLQDTGRVSLREASVRYRNSWDAKAAARPKAIKGSAPQPEARSAT